MQRNRQFQRCRVIDLNVGLKSASFADCRNEIIFKTPLRPRAVVQCGDPINQIRELRRAINQGLKPRGYRTAKESLGLTRRKNKR